MKASARIVARTEPDGGVTRLKTLAGEAPLMLRRTSPADPLAPARVHLVGGTAGPIGGDELRCTIDVGPGARLEVRSVAASVALPGPQGRASRMDIEAKVAQRARLAWRPEPTVAARGANHRLRARVELSDDAALVWRVELLLGRDGEDSGSVAARLRVVRGGRVLLDHEIAVGPEYPGSLGPGVAGGHRAVGTVLVVEPRWEQDPPKLADPCDAVGGGCAALRLSGPAVLITAAAPDGPTLSRLLDGAIPA